MKADTKRQDELRAAWHEGYTAALHSRETATWQLDRERRKVARKLQALQFDGGSHENLAKIAYAIYPCATGWTCESAAGLRDKLIELMGGVSDESVHVGGLRCVDGCMGDVSNGGDTGRTHDSPSNRDRNHMGVREGVGGDDGGHCESTCQHCDACSDVRAGGVGESTETITAELRKYAKTQAYPHNDRLRAIADRIDEQVKQLKHDVEMWRDRAEDMRMERDDAERERDELKKHCRNQQKQLAEFNRVMNTWHWDAENHKQWCPMSLDREVRKATERWESACGRIGELKDERDELQKRLSELETFDPDTALAAFGDDNDELRKLLSRVAQLLTQAEQDRDTNYANWMDCKEKVLQKNITIGELSDELDRYKAACEAAQSLNRDMMDGISQLRSSLSSVLDALDGGDAR